MSERSDVDLGFAGVTRKVMPNGQMRIRTKLANGVTTTVTEMPRWDSKDCIPWEEEHFHQGLIEHYLIISGRAVITHSDGGFGIEFLREEGFSASRRFVPGISHLVLLGPGCIIQTTTKGVPVGNPDKSNNDWWPGNASLLSMALTREAEIISFLLNKSSG